MSKTYLGEGLAIRTYFEYEWEHKQGGMPNLNPPEHSVTIYRSNLPEVLRKSERRPYQGEVSHGLPLEPSPIPPPVLKKP